MSYLSHIRKFNPRKVDNLNPLELEDGGYYVVEVSFNGANPAHKAIYYHSYNGRGQLFNSGYEEVYELYYLSFYSFKIIEHIKSMEGR